MHMTDQAITPHLLRRASGAPDLTEPPAWRESGPVLDLFKVLLRRWPVIASTVAVIVAAAVTYCVLAEPLYRAQATLLIEPRAPQLLGSQRFAGADDPFASTKYDYYVTQYRLLESPAIGKRVIERLRLAEDPRFLDLLGKPEGPDGVPALPTEAALLSAYVDHLEILPVRATRLVRVAFESTDPGLAADVANAHARAYVELGLERVYGGMEQVRTFLESKLGVLHEQMESAATALIDYQSAHHLLPVNLRQDVASERLMDLSRRLTQAEAERIVVEAEYTLVQQGDLANLPAVLSNPTIQRLRENYNTMAIEHANLAAKWRPTYPGLRRLEAQMQHAQALIDAEARQTIEGVEVRYRQTTETVRRLQAELDGQRQALIGRQDAEGELQILARDAETTRALYESLVARVKELDIAGGANISHISIAEPALPPRAPSSPRTRITLILSLITGLLLGTGIAFLRDSLDRTIRDPRDIQRATGLGILAVVPELGIVPAARRLRGRTAAGTTGKTDTTEAVTATPDAEPEVRATPGVPTLVLGDGYMPPSAEAYRTLRTSLLLRKTPTSPRVILLTSAVGTEGKTTTAVNTAAALASCGATVLLIDGDLRLPRCHDALGMPLRPGLGEYLGGQLRYQPIQTTSVANLSFVAAGRPPQNPTELLTSWRMWQLVRGARERFDFIVIDSPPVLAVSDALLLANVADGVVLVAEKRRTREDDLHTATMRLHEAGATVLGAVLNRGDVGHAYYQYTWSGPTGAPVEETALSAVSSTDTAIADADEQGGTQA